jgi:hypothetical protein
VSDAAFSTKPAFRDPLRIEFRRPKVALRCGCAGAASALFDGSFETGVLLVGGNPCFEEAVLLPTFALMGLSKRQRADLWPGYETWAYGISRPLISICFCSAR